MQGRLYIIAGCSGVGKGTLLNKFLENNKNVKLSISYTTRKPRAGEENGVNYFFVSEEEFKKSIENDEFLEWAKFSDNYYGTGQSFVEKSLAKCIDLILEIEIQGAFQVKEKIKDAVLIFILPPSWEVLEQRLRGRNTEDEDTIQIRLNVACDEVKASERFDYKVINDNIDTAIANLEEIFAKERNK